MPSPPTTASLMVRELMPEPYWRVRLVVGGVSRVPAACVLAACVLAACVLAACVLAACVPAASPPLSRRSRAVWTAWAGEVTGEVSRGFGFRQDRRGSGG